MGRWTLILLIITSFSCGDKYCFQSAKELNGSWAFADAFLTDVDISAFRCPTVSGKIMLTHTDDYPFENIYLRNSIIVNGESQMSDVVSFSLQDDLGIWKGFKNGNEYSILIDLPGDYEFPTEMDFSFQVEQYTREMSLQGVNKVEFIIP